MLLDEQSVVVGAEERKLRVTRYPDLKKPTQGRSCTTTEGRAELSTGSVTRKDGSRHTTANYVEDGNFIDSDSNRFDSHAGVSIAIEFPAEGYTKAHVKNMVTGFYNWLTTVDVNGESPLDRLYDGEK